MEPSTPSPYAHVFLVQPETPWPKLESNEPLSIFHATYWGKDIYQEKYKWLETQAEAHPMDSGEAPASFALYFDMYNLNMWVREDYALLYDDCMAYFNQPNVRSFPKPPSAVITGQPGVGKLHDFSSSSHLFNSSL
jgi:hypothetical protein